MEGESLRFFDRGGGRFRLRENEDSFCLGGTMEEAGLKLSPINDLHLRYGARMVSFSGYSMPLQYKMGVKQEHIHTRTKAGLFDVSHMGQICLKGDEVKDELEKAGHRLASDTDTEVIAHLITHYLEIGQTP